MQGSGEDDLSFCPSFNSYSSDRLAEIAGRVGDEFRGEDRPAPEKTTNDVLDEDGDDFEFALVRDESVASAGEIYYDGQIGGIFPIFNRDLLEVGDGDRDREMETAEDVSRLRIPLRNLFIQDREERGNDPPSSSSSEADELETVPTGTYCVWRPKAVDSSPSQCKKSNSTGSASKRWKFRDLLRRSNSDGKDSFVFLTPKNKEQKPEKINDNNSKDKKNKKSVESVPVTAKSKGKTVAGAEKSSPSAHEAFYVRNKAQREGDKRKSYLPYRQDLVGFFANVNSLGRTFPPF